RKEEDQQSNAPSIVEELKPTPDPNPQPSE
ncbi:MAG: hypothetical protein K0Q80_3008, partial [Microvirga sp.]|nr:hypothetical protein [Microvirga sp.]